MGLLQKYDYVPVAAEVDAFVAQTKENIYKWNTKEVYQAALGMIDLTSLTVTDSPSSIKQMVKRVNAFHDKYPQYPLPASICVYPNFANVIKKNKTEDSVHITVVGGCFPASQSMLIVKVLECMEAVKDGADEVDIVISVGSLLDMDYEEVSKEISTISQTIKQLKPSVHLKVILETGVLDLHQIATASFLAMEAGADFIKTSTGKVSPAATPEAAVVMCNCIKQYYAETGRKVGFKPAGGIVTAEDAALYYGIVDQILGSEWLTAEWFRFGASRMANNLLTALEGSEVKYY